MFTNHFNLKIFTCILLTLAFTSSDYAQGLLNMAGQGNIIVAKASTIATRFSPPIGYQRKPYGANSFATFLRGIKLKPMGSPVLLYDGSKKRTPVQASVLDMAILPQDLIQCADAVIKLRAEYLYSQKAYDKISFELTNGMLVPFSKFAKGERVKVAGNKTTWVTGNYKKGNGRDVFDEYLKFIYIYAGTISLSKQLHKANVNDIEIGDVFVQGGSPGHAIIVVDLAINKDTGKKIMMLVQSYMPSQELHVLISSLDISPWYEVNDAVLITPEWIFKKGSLKTW